MSITVSLHHKTTYRYDSLVQLAPHVVRLRPAPHSRTPILAYSLKVRPEQHFLNWQQDPFGNYQAHLVFTRETQELELEVDLVAELTAINPFDFFIDEHAQEYPFRYTEDEKIALAPYLVLLPSSGRVDKLAAEMKREIARAGRRTIDVLVDINRHVRDLLRYEIRLEPGVFSPDDTLERGHGSCRDFAWLMVQLTRRLGFGARFVSGYSIQLKADIKALDGPQGVAEDVTDLHAWAEIFLPGAGWIGFDATSGLLCAEGHLPLACTADPTSAAPVSGSYTPLEGDEARSRRHQVRASRCTSSARASTRASPSPTPRRPGRRSIASATRSTRALKTSDVRLSMGGEPTFVSIDDPDGAEWNTTALGPHKRQPRGRAVRSDAGALRARRPAALRPGQVVPGRAAAALGADLLLPQGRHADLASRRADRQGSRAGEAHAAAATRGAARADPRDRAAGRRRPGQILPGVRRRILLRLERATPAGQRVAVGRAPRRRAGARAAGARLRAGADVGGRLRAADRAHGLRRRGEPLAHRRLAAAQRAAAADPGRFAARLPAADRRPALGHRRRAPADSRARSVRELPCPADRASAAAAGDARAVGVGAGA